jgi:hypothetical protein
VDCIPSQGPAATVGHVPEDGSRGEEEGRMSMTLNKDQRQDYGTHEHWDATFAHELGVF